MTIKVKEVGRALYVATTFDLSGNSGISLKFTSPTGDITVITNPTVTAPSVDSPDIPGVGILPANTYMLYVTDGTLFTAAGVWTVCALYKDVTPKEFCGTTGKITIEECC